MIFRMKRYIARIERGCVMIVRRERGLTVSLLPPPLPSSLTQRPNRSHAKSILKSVHYTTSIAANFPIFSCLSISLSDLVCLSVGWLY